MENSNEKNQKHFIIGFAYYSKFVGFDNGVVKTGVPSMSMIVPVIMISSLAVIYFVRKRVK